jgi:hypothetical protein
MNIGLVVRFDKWPFRLGVNGIVMKGIGLFNEELLSRAF